MAEIQMSQIAEGSRLTDFAKDGDVLVFPDGNRLVAIEWYYMLWGVDDGQLYRSPEPGGMYLESEEKILARRSARAARLQEYRDAGSGGTTLDPVDVTARQSTDTPLVAASSPNPRKNPASGRGTEESRGDASSLPDSFGRGSRARGGDQNGTESR